MKKILKAAVCITLFMTMSVLTACTEADNPVFVAGVILPDDAEFEDGAMLVRQWPVEEAVQ